MRILILLPILALAGCASPTISGVRIDSGSAPSEFVRYDKARGDYVSEPTGAGDIVNESGQTLHNVKISGRVWIAGEAQEVNLTVINTMEKNARIKIRLLHRLGIVEWVNLRGTCKEGSFTIVWHD